MSIGPSRVELLALRQQFHPGSSIRFAGCITVALLATVAASVAAPARAAPTRLLCGTERWTVKTLQDRPKLLAVRPTTIAFLVSRPAPASPPNTRLPFERHVYRVSAAVTLVRQEADGDLHLVLRDGTNHMIAESPSGNCLTGATAARQTQMRTARAAVKVCAHAQVTGVAFFDFRHGQTGVAENAIELHPVLGFRCP